jgi:hypothetical protein
MDQIFHKLQVVADGNDPYLVAINVNAPVKHKIYSDKSFIRETKALSARLSNCLETNKTLVWVAPFHEKIFSNLEKHLVKNLVWISPVNFTPAPKFIIDNLDKLQFFLREINRSDSFLIEVHVCFKLFGLQDSFQNSLLRFIKNSAVRLKTIAHFSSLWKNNFRRNHKKWLLLPDISKIDLALPDLFVLGGPSVDLYISQLKNHKNIWCADTALPTLLHYNILPQCVFSLDAGHGSYEHFITSIDNDNISKMTLVVDPLSFSPLFDLKFKNTFTCANSNPLVQQSKNAFTIIENSTDDVSGFMQGVYKSVYENESTENLNLKNPPKIIGHDRGHVKKVTHLRGSAYHLRQYSRNNRLSTPELYFYRLSSRYSHN